jgi:hypothetical protein
MNRNDFLRALTLTTLGGLTYSCKQYDSLDLDLGNVPNLNLNLGNPKEELIAFYQKFKKITVSPNSRKSAEDENDFGKIILDKLEKLDNKAFQHFSKVFADPEIVNLKNTTDLVDKKTAAKTLLSKSSKKLSEYVDKLQVVVSENLQFNIKQNHDVSQESFKSIISQIKIDIDKKASDNELTYHEKTALESLSAVYDVFGETLSKLYADASIVIIDDLKKQKSIKSGRIADFWDDLWGTIVGFFETAIYVFVGAFVAIFIGALLTGVALGLAILTALYFAAGISLFVLMFLLIYLLVYLLLTA